MEERAQLELLLRNHPPIHIIGAGGVGMSALAILLQKRGFTVTASDISGGTYLEKIKAHGITTWTGNHPENILPSSVVFYSTAIKENDPERKWARENSHEFRRHPLLHYLTRDAFTVAVTGTHGKTTTTAWVAYLLEKAGLEPTVLAGGTIRAWGSNLRLGSGKWKGQPLFVLEADESDHSFLHIAADVGCILNMEMDHVDHYSSMADVEKNFKEFISHVCHANGKMIFSIESTHLAETLCSAKECIFSHPLELDEHKGGIRSDGTFFPVLLKGRHNLTNASVVFNMGKYFRIPDGAIGEALATFTGVSRRMEIIHAWKTPHGETVVMDDYGHHPTEIRTVLETLRKEYSAILAVWEPHRISRFVHFSDDFISLIRETRDIRWGLMPFYHSGDVPEDYPDFEEKKKIVDSFMEWKFQSPEDLSVLAGDILQNSQENNPGKKVVVFFGAGNSSQWAYHFRTLLPEI